MAQFNKYDSLIDLSAIKRLSAGKMAVCVVTQKRGNICATGTVGKYLGVVESGYFKSTPQSRLRQ